MTAQVVTSHIVCQDGIDYLLLQEPSQVLVYQELYVPSDEALCA